MPHLLLAVTAHGFGHLAQSAPVVHELRRRIPDLRVTLQSDVDEVFARRRLPPGIEHRPEATDVGLLMDGPLVTRWRDSLDAYIAFDADYERRLADETEILRRLAPDLVLADIPWLPLDAARGLGIPAVGLCSLSWNDVLAESPIGEEIPAALAGRMQAAYAGAERFIRPAPSMPMAWLPNGVDVGPIARVQPGAGPETRARLKARLGIPVERPLVLMQFGGFSGFDPLLDWPEQDRIHWLVQDLGRVPRRDASGLTELGLSVLDVLGGVDLMLVKPGYGTFTEAACNGVPVLYVRRGDWPEEPALIEWLHALMPAAEIDLETLVSGRLWEVVADLLAAGPPAPVPPSGVEAAADLIAPMLAG